MKLTRYLFVSFILFIHIGVLAQGRYTVSGVVKDESGTIQKGATVFISGTQKITSSDNEGKFEFANVDAGTYQLSVKLLGFYPFTENIQLRDKSVTINVRLKVKTIMLSQVVIGNNSDWEANYAIFKEQFLGTSANAEKCVITNPKVISFGTAGRNVLTAEADEFLIIENRQLGYRVHYLLKNFEFNKILLRTKYDGDTNFEELEAEPLMKIQWAKNRFAAYRGSLMHYLRSVYTDTQIKEGFLTHQLYQERGGKTGLSTKIDNRIVNFDTIKMVVDTTFTSLKFTSILIDYNPEQANHILQKDTNPLAKPDPVFTGNMSGNTSVLKLFLPYAIIDRKGSYTDYRTFLVQGNWGKRRIGDQLPFEYRPPFVTE
ncbi:carboxypeptidase-like regulatory domain-containing protein [Mucilaginibacter sp. UYCu711]|uniref:carboxypeptidase-like regulatory domain-containing protein n=1 Tax=Mucilaginibacter sp. UYCu711 TaxID=3156339 RepID=UPI003D1D2459